MEERSLVLDSTLTDGEEVSGLDRRDAFGRSRQNSMENSLDHWSNYIRQSVLYIPPETISKREPRLPITIAGGSSNRQFVFVDIISHTANVDAGELFEGDILLQVNDIKVGGFTLRDIECLLVDQVHTVSPFVHLAVIQPDAGLPLDLEDLLRQRFSPNSPEHSLQCDVRSNINRYTVPYTTKVEDAFDSSGKPRFHVVSKSDFVELEEQQYFLESGVFQENFYGTPCPPNITAQELSVPNGHESHPEDFAWQAAPEFAQTGMETSKEGLPTGWEKVTDAEHGTYYVDHINKTTQFESPSANAETTTENVQLQSDFTESVVSLENEDVWEEFRTRVIKSSSGFGFTLQPVGPSYDALELFFDVEHSNLLNAELSQYYQTSVKIYQDVLQITEIIPSGSADSAGLKPGDVLYRVNGTSAVNCDHKVLATLLQSLTEGDVVQVVAKRFISNSTNHIPLQNSSQGLDDISSLSCSEIESSNPSAMVAKSDAGSKLGGGRVHVNPAVEHMYASVYNDQQSSTSSLGLVHKYKPPSSGSSNHTNSHDHNSSRMISQNARPIPPLPPKGQHSNVANSFNLKADRNFHSNEQLNGTTGDVVLQSHSSAAIGRSNTLTSRMNRVALQNQTPPSIAGHIINVSILKSNMGFGFTIASTAQGQMEVMQIVDKERCHQLRTGDVILSVNGYTPSSSRVQMDSLLKNCPVGRIALLTVLRDPFKHSGELSTTQDAAVSSSSTRSVEPRARSNTEGHEFVVTLRKQINGFGFEILGGAEEDCNIMIGTIMPNSAASQNGRMRSGDEIISIDSETVLGASHYRAVSLLNKAKISGVVTMVLRHTPVSMVTSSSGNGQQHKHGTVFDVQLHRKPDEGFGFVVVTSLNKQYTKIGGIVPGSPADSIRSLQLDDRVHAVNGTKVQGLDHAEIVGLIKGSGLSVTLTISKAALPTNQAKSQEDKIVSALTNQFLNTSLSQREPVSESESNAVSSRTDRRRSGDHGQSSVPPRRPVSLPPDTDLKNVSSRDNARMHDHSPSSVGQILSCRLVRDDKIGFGFSVRGGVDVGIPINVFKIAPDGPAERSQLIQIGDVVLEVNGLSTHRMSHQQFLEAVRTTPSQVLLVLSRASTSTNPGTPVGNF